MEANILCEYIDNFQQCTNQQKDFDELNSSKSPGNWAAYHRAKKRYSEKYGRFH